MEPKKINWGRISREWDEHWRNRPDDYTPPEWMDKFWNDRGGRDRYFRTVGDRQYQRYYLKEN